MKSPYCPISISTVARITFFIIGFLALIPYNGNAQSFQRFYGNTQDDLFSKVIKDGSNYYVLGQNEPTSGAIPRATVTRLDALGQHQWTLTLNISSIWNDAILIPGGDLLVVGSTLPLDPTTNSLMGRVTSSGGGNFTWLRSYDDPGRNFFTRIINNPVPDNAAFPYYVLGSQNQPGGTTTTEDVVMYNLDAMGTFNWKKKYTDAGDNEFFRDFEALPTGDLLLAGNGASGLIFKTDNAGNTFNGVQISQIYFNDIGLESSGGLYASANGLTNSDAHIFKLDRDLFVQWDIIIPQLTTISQVWEGTPGEIYATGRGIFGGESRGVIIKLLDSGPSVVWVKYLNAGSGFVGGSSWLLPNNEIAYTDARIIPGGLGGDCAFISVSDLDLLTACMVSEDMATLVFADPIPDGPLLPPNEFQDFPMGTNLSVSALNWLDGEVCNNDPCEISIGVTFVNNCGLIQFASNTSGPGIFTYSWNFGDPNSGSNNTSIAENPSHDYSACGMYDVSLTVECPDGTILTAMQTITVSDNILPTAICVLPFGVELDANCMFNVTVAMIDGGSFDNCQIQSMSVSPMVLNGCGVFPITLTIEDWCGNISTCSTEIQTIEVIPPMIQCPGNITIIENTAPVIINNIHPTLISDNCGVASVSYTITGATNASGLNDASGQVFNFGSSNLVYVVTDNCGNTSSCMTNIQIFEEVPPMIQCGGNIDTTAASCPFVLNNIQPNIVAGNCGTPSTTFSISGATNVSGQNDASGQIFNQGLSTVSYTVIDSCGNIVTCAFDVIVKCGIEICCPEFSLMQLGSIMPCDTICLNASSGVHSPMGKSKMFACKNSVQSYYVFPDLPGFTYNWTLIGGALTSSQGNNPGEVTWGNGNEGFLQVIITDAIGTCRDTISKEVCLQDSPMAAFTVAPSTTICTNQPISFTNTSVGANSYLWDFGDGTSSTSPNPPPHNYPLSGTYTVLLTVSNGAANINSEIPCGCMDTATIVITVVAGTGPTITSSCKKMLCPGDTATYCVSPGCAPLNWSVIGGTIIASFDSCITVLWDATAPAIFPASVSVTNGCGGVCGSNATLNVPVLWPNLPISGPKLVCVGTTTTYSLPTMPGTFYTWNVVGGTIIGPNQNTPSINVEWGNFASTGTITCTYNNPYSGCSGSSTCVVQVKSKFTINGPNTVCEGISSNFNVTSGGTATWTISPGISGIDYTSGGLAGVSGINVTWITPGNYTITAIPTVPATFCNPFSSINVRVNPAPVLNTIVGISTVCPNQLYNYSVSSNLAGGNFVWSFGASTGGTITPYGPNNSMASVNFTGTGPWTLMATQTVNDCMGSTTLPVTLIPVPVLPATPIMACIGGQATVSVVISGGPGPYTWSSTPAVSLVSAQGGGSATYEIHGAGTITVSNCSGPSNAISVTANQPQSISITSTGSLCGGNLQLSAPGCGAGTTYQWFGPITGNTPTISVTKPGTYTIEVECPDGCISVATHTVAPAPLPTVSISSGDPLGWCIPSTPNVNLQALTLSNGCSFQWYDANGSISGAVNSTYNATSAGSYYVVANCGGCIVTSNTITVSQITCTGGGGGNCTGVTNPLGTITTSLCNPKSFSVNVAGCSGAAVTWDLGDGNSATGTYTSAGVNSVSHTYANASAYLVTASITCNGCDFTVHSNANVPLIADFLYSVQCGLNGDKTIDLLNTSQTLGGWNVTNVTWSTDCGTPITPNPGFDFSINTTPPCSPNITMIITASGPNPGQTCTESITYPFQFVNTPLSIIAPDSVCKDQTYTFLSSPTGANIVQYQWTVGGIPVSQDSTLNYAFDGNPTNPIIGLTVVDSVGCVYTALDTFVVVIPRPLTIAPVKICPDCLPPAVLSSTPVGGFSNYQWFQNGSSIAGANSATYLLCQPNASGNYYVTAEDDQNGKCPVTSDTVQVIYQIKPVADIAGETIKCVSGNGPYTFNLSNANNDPNISYLWTTIPSGSATFNPNNLNSTSATVTALGSYQFVLSVTDTITGCMSSDTFCVYICQRPLVNVSGPSGTLCEGQPHTFTATASPGGNYVYVWSNGATGPTMTTSQAGFYSVTVTDSECGCSSTYFGAGFIQPKPSVVLFPVGCDTLCDTEIITPPLPLGMGWPNNLSGYMIQWFLNGSNTPFYTGTMLNLAGNIPTPLSYGLNNISIVVTYQGCSDTSDVYSLFIEPCCVCERDLMSLSSGGVDYPVFCDPHVGSIPSLPCPANDVSVSGFIGFVDSISGELCEETSVLWELIKPDSSTWGGITTNFTAFTFPKDSVDEPGLYCLNLTVLSPDGNNTCVCKISWIQESCPPCCTSLEDFCDRLEDSVSISVDNDLCKATLNIDDFGCDGYIDWVDWDYPNQQQPGPYPPGSMPMYTYPGSGTYTICYLAIELDSTGEICQEKLVCDTISIDCNDCYCGTFSNLFFPLNRNVQGVTALCDSTEVNVGCPGLGNSIQLTGLFQCAGPNCPPTAQVTWKLYRLPDTTTPVASGSNTANPYFGISILPTWYATPGSYELRLTGHCGIQECPCIVRFNVDCIDPCPCDVETLSAAVNQGFAVVKYPTSCKACFVPVALSDCETVEWHLNSSNGTLLGTSLGNNVFCHTFPGAGSYTVVMKVTRLKSDGSVCKEITMSQVVTLTCSLIAECRDSDFPNPTFSEGAVSGGMLSGGETNGWTAAFGEPEVIEGSPESFDAWTIQLSGNFDTSAVLTTLDSICMEKSTGIISMRAAACKFCPLIPDYPLNKVNIIEGKLQAQRIFASIPLSVFDSSEWVEIEIPYDLSLRTDLYACSTSNNGVWIRPAIYVTNALSSHQGGEETYSFLQVDNFCINGTPVTAVEDLGKTSSIRLFPNPTTGELTILFDGFSPRDGQIQILDLVGKVVYSAFLANDITEHSFSLEHQPQGVYIIKVSQNGNSFWTKKIIKQ